MWTMASLDLPSSLAGLFQSCVVKKSNCLSSQLLIWGLVSPWEGQDITIAHPIHHPQSSSMLQKSSSRQEQLRHPGLSSSTHPSLKRWKLRPSLVVQWLRSCLPVQGSNRLRKEDPMCHRAGRPTRCSCWPHTPQIQRPRPLEPVCCNFGTHTLYIPHVITIEACSWQWRACVSPPRPDIVKQN